MADFAVLQKPAFQRVFKKFAASHKAVVDDPVRTIVANPEIGEAKKGDLTGVCVLEFPLDRKQLLLADVGHGGARAGHAMRGTI